MGRVMLYAVSGILFSVGLSLAVAGDVANNGGYATNAKIVKTSADVHIAYEVDESGHQSNVPAVVDLFMEAVAVKKSSKPILIMFSAEDCNYCEKLESEVLNPMIISGEYNDKVIIRKVMIDDFDTVRDFNGVSLDAQDFAEKYQVSVTPTVMLMDSKGEVLAPKILGINTVELYSAYLDQAIDLSYETINSH